MCKNPALAQDRGRKREELLLATERELDKVVEAVRAGRLKGQDAIGLRVGKIVGSYKVGKHFQLDIADDRFSYQRDLAGIASEAALDGLYVIRSSLRSRGVFAVGWADGHLPDLPQARQYARWFRSPRPSALRLPSLSS